MPSGCVSRPKHSFRALHRRLRGFEGLGGVDVPLHTNDAPVAQIDDGRGVDHDLDAAALTALVLAVEDDHPVAGIDELSRLDPVLIPYVLVLQIEGLTDLGGATQDFAFLEAPTLPWSSTFGSIRSASMMDGP